MTDFTQFLLAERDKTKQSVDDFMTLKVEVAAETTQTYQEMLGYLQTDVLRGGKWVRPTLTRLAYALVDGQGGAEALVTASAAVELFHRFLLIHDDIIDKDLERHGGPTIEKVYEDYFERELKRDVAGTFPQGMAIVAGDVLHTLAYELVLTSGFTSKITSRVLRALNQCLELTAAGWALETVLKYRRLHQVTEAEIVRAMDLVSAHYSVIWPLRIGQVLAGKELGDWLPALETFGHHVGLAFQIQDDILALFGEAGVTGKPVGSDLREGKKSMVLWYAYQAASQADKEFLESQLLQPIEKTDLAKFRQLIETSGALQQARDLAQEHVAKATAALASLEHGYDPEAVRRLEQLASFLAERDH